MPREVPNQGFSKFGRKGNGGWEAKKWKVEEHTDLGLPLLFESSEWERDMKGLYCDSQAGVNSVRLWACNDRKRGFKG